RLQESGRSHRWLGFRCADKSAHKSTVHCRGNPVDINTSAAEQCTGVLDSVNARRFQADIRKPGFAQLRPVFVCLQSTCDAAHPKEHVLANLVRNWAASHDIRYREASSGP